MDITILMTEESVLVEIGKRIARHRIERQLTQADLAEQAGVSKRTVERVEAGYSAQMSTFIRILRVLNLLQGLDHLIPEAKLRPMDLLRLKGKERKRASKKRTAINQSNEEWKWDDEQ